MINKKQLLIAITLVVIFALNGSVAYMEENYNQVNHDEQEYDENYVAQTDDGADKAEDLDGDSTLKTEDINVNDEAGKQKSHLEPDEKGKKANDAEQAFIDKAQSELVDDEQSSLELEIVQCYAMANEAYYQKDYGKAVNGYNRVLQLQPGYVAAYYGRGNAHYYAKNYRQAIDDYSKILLVVPEDTDIWYGRAISHYHLGQFEQSIADYGKVLELKADYADAYYGRGVSYYQLGKYEQALLDYDKVLQINPERVEAYYGKGSACYQMENYFEALKSYNEIIKLRPNDKIAYIWRDKCDEMMKNNGEGRGV